MKKACAGFLLLLMLSGMLPAAAENYVDLHGPMPDQTVYPGHWQDTYVQILTNHTGPIHSYQARTIDLINNGRERSMPCMTVSLQDLTGDGIPELIFMEENVTEERGDLYIYTGDGSSTHCMLYVPGITRLDYDDMLGFNIYLSSAAGETLVIEHYVYEMPWILQFVFNGWGRYTLLNYWNVEWDYSAEDEDHFFRNGQEVSLPAYQSAIAALQNSKTREISSYIRPDYSAYGLDCTWESAVFQLNSGSRPSGQAQNTGAVYGLAISKLATRTGPSTSFAEGGTYEVKGQYIRVLAKAYDRQNEIWWVKCEIPYRNELRVLWTGYKRFDPGSLPLESLPEEKW